MPKALRAEINDVVVKYTERKLRKDGTLDVAVMAHEMTQSLVDMINRGSVFLCPKSGLTPASTPKTTESVVISVMYPCTTPLTIRSARLNRF